MTVTYSQTARVRFEAILFATGSRLKWAWLLKMARLDAQAGKAFFLQSRFPLTANTVFKEGIQYIYGYCFEELIKGVL